MEVAVEVEDLLIVGEEAAVVEVVRGEEDEGAQIIITAIILVGLAVRIRNSSIITNIPSSNNNLNFRISRHNPVIHLRISPIERQE
mmetsp:Transcript_887/g.1870  ORF Transcript_887/g.1870 Transcript_887/m.1870 type:complete len:86 (+) Transcript_887:2683-2940(+)